MQTPGAWSRRNALGAAGAVSAAVVTTAVVAPADAAVTYTPGSYPATRVLSPADRHLLNRFTYGVTPELTAQVIAAGGIVRWITAQVNAPYDPSAKVADWWPDLRLSPPEIWQRHQSGVRSRDLVMRDYGKRLMMRRILAPYQIREVMTEFWENHFHVPARDGQSVVRVGYGDVIRRHALGDVEAMLFEAITHPAMLVFLDNVLSTASHPNENLARELLELHTVGIGNFTENDVKDCARILTGWKINIVTGLPEYVSAEHATGPVSVLGFSDANGAKDGRDLTRRFLSYLSKHPATATRIARKLGVVFVNDAPSAALVQRLATAYIRNGTRIVPVLTSLVNSPDFLASAGSKLREPSQDIIASHRVLGTTIAAPASPDDGSAANALVSLVTSMAPAPMTWPRPDGIPLDNASWASPARVMASVGVHTMLVSRTWDPVGITYRTPSSWMPKQPIDFRDLVDHLARTLHGRTSKATLLQACCEATGLIPTTVITSTHQLVTRDMALLLAVFLDHPDHLHR